MTRCKDCKYWEPPPTEKYAVRPYRACLAGFITGPKTAVLRLDGVWTADEPLVTGGEFGCVHGEPK